MELISGIRHVMRSGYGKNMRTKNKNSLYLTQLFLCGKCTHTFLLWLYSYKELTCSSTLHSLFLFLFYHHLCLSWIWTGFYLVAKPGGSLQANFRGSCTSSIQQNNLSAGNLLRRKRFLGLACAFRAISSSTRRSYPRRPSFTTTIILRETHHHLLFTLINSS